MITVSKDKLWEVLDALELFWRDVSMNRYAEEKLDVAIDTVRSMLEQKPVEPVAWMTKQEKNLLPMFHRSSADALSWGDNPMPLYALEKP